MQEIEKIKKKDRNYSDCGRPRGFRVRGGRFQTDDDHDLCQRCFRARLNQIKPKGVHNELA